MPAARAASTASRSGPLDEPHVSTASSPSPSISAQCAPKSKRRTCADACPSGRHGRAPGSTACPLGVGQAVGGVLTARRARDRHRRHAGRRVGVTLVVLGIGFGHQALGREVDVIRPIDHDPGLTERLVRQHDDGRLQRFGQMHRPLRGQQAVGNRQRRGHDMRRVAVQPVDGDVEVALLRLGGDAGRRPRSHHVDDDERDFRGHGEAEQFDHQRQAGTGRRRQRRHAAIARADDHVDRGQFVLGLHQHAAALRQRPRHPFQDLGRRRDRVAADEFDAAPQRAEARRLVAGDRPARPRAGSAGRASLGTVLSGATPTPTSTAFPLASIASGLRCPIDAAIAATIAVSGSPISLARMPRPIIATRPPSMPLASFVSGTNAIDAPEFFRNSGASPAAEIGDDQAVAIQWQLGGEAIDIVEIEREQHVEPIAGRLHRLGGEPDASRPPRRRESAVRSIASSGRRARNWPRRRAGSDRRSSRRRRLIRSARSTAIWRATALSSDSSLDLPVQGRRPRDDCKW